jgi:hypothetical protein
MGVDEAHWGRAAAPRKDVDRRAHPFQKGPIAPRAARTEPYRITTNRPMKRFQSGWSASTEKM